MEFAWPVPGRVLQSYGDTGKSITLDMAGDTGRMVRASGSMELNLANFVQFSEHLIEICKRSEFRINIAIVVYVISTIY